MFMCVSVISHVHAIIFRLNCLCYRDFEYLIFHTIRRTGSNGLFLNFLSHIRHTEL